MTQTSIVAILASGPLAGKTRLIVYDENKAPPLRYEERVGSRIASYLRRDDPRQPFKHTRIYDYSHTRMYC
jgi:hypothetical protein